MNVLKILEAIEFVSNRHAGQVRPGGESQLAHVLRVAKAVVGYAEERHPGEADQADTLVMSAILHDVLEDTSATDSELAERFGGEVARTVRALSHVCEDEPDEDYLARVAWGGTVAIVVKRFDRLDNFRGLANMSADFRERKLKEIRAALPVWREIDREGAMEIEKEVNKYE